ncbi:hypothetical protein [Clostridium botulinum]|uniref:Peptidase S1 domain-containing protein n=2 Tax=Clostridium botulinum TaxID=1491 RepID=A0A9Q1UWC0_CLOBO|nr:hypothetical protein [Clostridium botulinum]KLU74559.1 hypothetical protein CBC3_13570 [Clostridium botulinum V891]KOA78052.1 hypothetical protein ADU77_06705 [Clostridium botulinum]KOA83018.1 hypothetical protein ADU80_12965 [Clostridium botulinum]KOA83330.1 hypothetical protein ADU75_11060 [Clostridium botulinum]KOA83512.1 hypothetical protein ADU74_12230 [Clostridium botulinum]
MHLSYSQMISFICKNDYEFFSRKVNVVGIGRGYKIKNGICTNEECIKVLVSKKVSANEIPVACLIPNIYKGIPTDVSETGPLKFQVLKEKVRPTLCGYSIGPVNVTPCQNEKLKNTTTLGCLVTDGKHEFILTTNHGIVNGKFRSAIDITQPSIEDGGKYPADFIGHVVKCIDLEEQSTFYKPKNLVDACLIHIAKIPDVSSIIYHVGIPIGAQLPELHEDVLKVGRTSGLTFGETQALDSTVTIHDGSKTYVFEDQILTSKMSENGDSGAILMNNSKYVLGMNIGGGNSCSIFCTIKNILKLFKVKVVIK